MKKSNSGLVEFSKKALLEKWVYILGFWGLIATNIRIQEKFSQVGIQHLFTPEIKDYILKNNVGKRAVDCGGLIKAYLWWRDNDPVYNSSTDWNVDMMLNRAELKGVISTLPETPGTILWLPGHAGVYIGKGKVIEARGTFFGVVETSLETRGWTHWFQHPLLENDTQEVTLFNDVPKTHWAYQDIMEASSESYRIIIGGGDGKFNPQGGLTRAQAAVIAMRIIRWVIKYVESKIQNP